MFSQDWNPINIGKGSVPQKPKGPSGAPPKIIRNDLESFKHKEIPKDIADKIKNARIQKGLTQDKLAQTINVRPVVIKDIEACKGPYDHVNINKTLRFLGLTLKH